MNLNYPFKRGWKPVPESERLRQLFEEVFVHPSRVLSSRKNAGRIFLFFGY